MNTKSESCSASRTDVGQPKLWFGLLGGGVAWLSHLLLAYLVAEFGCVSSLGQRIVLGMSVVTWLLIAVSAATLVVAIATTVAAYRAHTRLEAGLKTQQDSVPAGWIATAKMGWITSGLFALVIAVESVPIFYFIKDC